MRKQTALISALVAGLVLIAASVQALLRDPAPLPELSRTDAPSAVAAPNTPDAPAPSSAPLPDDASSAQLQEALRQEIAARRQLGETVARLEKELKQLKSTLGDDTPASTRASSVPEFVAAPGETPRVESEPPEAARARRVGMDPTTVTQIRQRFEQLEMDRLYLKDRAQREGWSGTVRYSNEVAKIEERRADVRNSLGESEYDAYLYANGDPNRVSIRELITGSPAGAAGLEPGDTVLRYDGKRVFTTRELQNATAAGRAGENVPVEIEREGRSMTLYVPRGPLGVYLDMDRKAP
jgi:hypothetical protein